jgi:WD40 repeat protein
LTLGGGPIHALALSPGGRLLGTGHADRSVRLWDACTGKQRRCLGELGQVAQSLTFSATGKSLAAVGGDYGCELRLWDVGTGKLRLHRTRGQSDTPVGFSPDDSTLAVRNCSHVDLLDLATGRVRRDLEQPGPPNAVAFSPAGRLLAVGTSSPIIHVWDWKKGKDLRVPGAPPLVGVRLLRQGPGRLVGWCPEDASVRVWEARRGRLLRSMPTRRQQAGGIIALLSDERTAVVRKGGRIARLDLRSGKTGFALTRPEAEVFGRITNQAATYPRQAAVAPDERTLAVLFTEHLIHLGGYRSHPPFRLERRDAADGRFLGELPSQAGGSNANLSYPSGKMAFSPDGRWLAACTGAYPWSDVWVWDRRTLRRPRQLPPDAIRGGTFAFFPDSRLLVAGGVAAWLPPNDEILTLSKRRFLDIWDLGSGKKVMRLPQPRDEPAVALALSGCGRFLACGTRAGDVRLHDLLTGKAVGRLSGHRGAIRELVFLAADRLASVSEDATILIWDLAPLTGAARASAAPLRRGEAEVLSRRLRHPHALEAYRAAWKLRAAPEVALPLLRKHLVRVRPVAARRLAGLLARLDDDDFDVREAASEELTRLGELVEPELRAALARKPSPEAARRLRRVLAGLKRSDLPPRAERALAVLEQMGTPAARRLLTHLAAGAAGAPLTRRAKECLLRLGWNDLSAPLPRRAAPGRHSQSPLKR